jgi:uncharacterized membrane protein YcaP (DUF421 family)
MDFKDLVDVFGPTMPLLELVLRGSVMYWFLFLVFRLILRRDAGGMGLTDFLFIVLLGDAAQNGMIGAATSATDAIALIATLVFWNVLIDWASFRFPAVERVLAPPRLCLVRDGRLDRRNMRRQFISLDELMSKVRQEGLEDLSRVRRMYLESDGEISLIRQPGRDGDPPPHPSRVQP